MNEDNKELPADFDPALYLRINPDVAAAGIDPVRHYLEDGRRENRAYRVKPKIEVRMLENFSLSADDFSRLQQLFGSWPEPKILPTHVLKNLFNKARKIFGRARQKRANAFDLILFSSKNDLQAFVKCRRAFVMTEDEMLKIKSRTEKSLGAVSLAQAERYIERVAWYSARKLGIIHGPRLGLPPKMIARAWFFAIQTELMTLLPLKHFFKSMKKPLSEGPVVIPIDRIDFDMFGHWSKNQMYALYAHVIMKKYGIESYLVGVFPGSISNKDEYLENVLRIIPNQSHFSSFNQQVSNEFNTSKSLLHPAGVRNHSKFLQLEPGMLVTQSGWIMPELDNQLINPPPDVLIDCTHEAEIITLAGKPILRPLLPGKPQAFLLDISLESLIRQGLRFLESSTVATYVQSQQVISRLGVDRLYICDHIFFESAILAEAVLQQNGEIHLLPHSMNAGHTFIWNPHEIKSITCITKIAAEIWESCQPSSIIDIDSSIMLTQSDEARNFDSSSPLTVIVLGGYHSKGLLEILDCEAHVNSYRKIIRLLRERASEVNVLFKPRPPWESAEWLNDTLELHERVPTIDRHPMRIDFPNLIYVSVSLASSALLEGLSRGIPCMIVRETDVVDYLCLDEDIVPTGDADLIASKIFRCKERHNYFSLANLQSEWLRSKTRFPSGR